MNNLLLLLIVCIILLIFLLFLILNKKEKFSQCTELNEDQSLEGLCKPFYGIPPAQAINPFYHNNADIFNYESNQTQRIEKNREAARQLCDKTPGCSGISQSTVADGPNETYLCKNEWDGTSTVSIPDYDFITYKCSTHNVSNTTLPSNKLLDAHVNTGIYNKGFNEFQYNKHINNKFKDNNLIKMTGTNDYIKFSVKCASHEIDHKIKSNLKQYIDFANTMDYCVGFHIHKTSVGYDVYFGKKNDNEDLILDSDGSYETYTAILTMNHFKNEISLLKNFKSTTESTMTTFRNQIDSLINFKDKQKIHVRVHYWQYTRHGDHTSHGYDFHIHGGYIGILIGFFRAEDDSNNAQEMFCCVGNRGGWFAGGSSMHWEPRPIAVHQRHFGGRIEFWRRGRVGQTQNALLLEMHILEKN